MRNAWEICTGKVVVRRKVDETKVEDKLDDLKPGDPLFPLNLDATSGLKIVPVHHDMDKQI